MIDWLGSIITIQKKCMSGFTGYSKKVFGTHLTGMVDEPGGVAGHGGVHHHVVVQPEHVAADAAAVVVSLPVVGEDGSYLLARILDHHLPRRDLPLAEQAPPVDTAGVHTHCLAGVLSQLSEPGHRDKM